MYQGVSVKRFTYKAVLLSIIGLTLALAGCGGGGGGGDNPNNPDPTPTPTPPADALNFGVSGSFFFQHEDQAYLMAIESGEYTLLPNTDWEQQNDRFPLGIAGFNAKPAYYEGNLLVLTVNSCKDMPNSFLANSSCIAVQDFFGNYIAEFDVDYDALGGDNPQYAAKLSHDKNFIALVRRPGQSSSTPKRLEIYDLDGRLISATQVDPESFEWLPDGRLIYSIGRSFFFTQPFSTEFESGANLPGSVSDGIIAFLSVSPDGSQVAFTLVSDSTTVSTDGTLWILDVSTLALNKFADVGASSGAAMIRRPRWSPDGRWIAALEGGSRGTGSINPGVPDNLYVIPADDAGNQTFILSQDDGERSAQVIRLRRYLTIEDGNASGNHTFNFPYWDFYWLP